jgi:hypothetical protein
VKLNPPTRSLTDSSLDCKCGNAFKRSKIQKYNVNRNNNFSIKLILICSSVSNYFRFRVILAVFRGTLDLHSAPLL